MKLSVTYRTVTLIVFGSLPIRSSAGRNRIATTTSTSFRPYKISYGALIDDAVYQDNDSAAYKSLKEALQTVGMITITNVFNDVPSTDKASVLDDSKQKTLGWLYQCSMESNASKAQTYHDGSIIRNTLATVSIPSQNVQTPVITSTADVDPLPESCDIFTTSSSKFRSKVTEVTKVLIQRLLMMTSEHVNDNDYDTLEDVLSNGEHLEHFHSFQYNQKQHMKSSSTKTNPASNTDDDVESTIHWHTDQGLFLMFTPARTLQPSQMSNMTNPIDSYVMKDGLYIQLLDGTEARVDFDENDDIVFMLGDGFNQYINPRLDLDLFRPTPHALMINPAKKVLSDDDVRVWYGRMVLPPNDAIHPNFEQNDMTFGELRTSMIDATVQHLSTNDAANDRSNMGPILSIGCSSGYVARDLAAVKCKSGTMYCWHSCLKYSSSLSKSCKAKKLVVGCGKNGKWWDGSHGSWAPTCLNPKTKPKGYPYNT